MINTFIQEFTEAAHSHEICNLQFYTEEVRKVSVNVYQGAPESNFQSEVAGCYVQGEYQGKTGYVYIEDFSKELFEGEIADLKEVAMLSDAEGSVNALTEVKCEKQEQLTAVDILAERLIQAEKEALAAHPGVKKFNHFQCGEIIRRISIRNDQGGCMEDENKYAFFGVNAEAEKDGVVQIAGGEILALSAEELDMSAAATEAASEAVGMLAAQQIKTGTYPVILKNSVICEMLGMFVKNFAADTVHKDLSKLAGKKGERIASSIVNLVEDPKLPGGANQRAFDDEGTPTSRKEIVKDGVLQMFLYNQEEAKKDGVASTGNGFKESCRSKPGVFVTNLKLEGETKPLEELMRDMGDGLYITNCDGMFAGADPVSGKFSLISKGYQIENGEIDGSVNQITVAGNFYDMLQVIEGIGEDYLMNNGDGGMIIAPSIYVKELVVSGL
ncbi:metallopeptidase TldD-related protein [Roseburia hominis]